MALVALGAVGCPEDPAPTPEPEDTGATDTGEPDAGVTPDPGPPPEDKGPPPTGCQSAAECDDSIACTTDECGPDGECTHLAKDFLCDDGNACNGPESCDAEEGCQASTEPLECDDGNVCNGVETCIARAGCVSSPSLECDDGKPCNGDELCDPVDGCQNGVPPAGCCTSNADCDNGNLCDGPETCESRKATCVFGNPLECDDGEPCDGVETCDPATGCQESSALECDDGDPCNGAETCTTGEGCQEGTPLDCDDGDPCNGVETCATGLGCAAGEPLVCDDGDACNGVETCTAGEGCAPGVGVECDDGDACNGIETCLDGDCAAGLPLDCDDGDPCTVDACVSPDGCALPTPVECGDGDACNGVETCTDGVGCEGGAALICDDGDACNGVETCDAVTGCVGGEALSCDDGDACNGVETCQAATGCTDGEALSCDDGLPCNGVETCSAETGCVAGEPPAGCCSSNTDCDDGNTCNGAETCDLATATCTLGESLTCDDTNPCNGVESCDPVAGCQAGKALQCSDGDPCNGAESCLEGEGCQPGVPIECDDDDACNGVETCLEGAGCQAGDALECDDADACNGIETCDPGTGCLIGDALECDDGLPCNGVESCDGAVGCVAGEPPLGCCSKNSECDDGKPCNGVEICDLTDNVCVLGAPVVCSDDNACNGLEACEPDTGGCTTGTALECDDGKLCTTDTCDPLLGCQSAPNTVECDDGSACTVGEACSDGACAGGTPLACDDGKGCTLDSCASATGCVFEPVTEAPTIEVTGVEADGAYNVAPTPVVTFGGGFASSTQVLVDGEAYVEGAAVEGEGEHTLTASALGCDGDAVTSTLTFTLDTTPPAVEIVFSPLANVNGWNNTPVTITFVSTDLGSGTKTVTDPITIATPGEGVEVSGTATDAAGNSTTVSAVVNTDFKAPTVLLSEPKPNQPGNDQLVTSATSLTFKGTLGDDALSGFDGGKLTSTKLQEVNTFEAPGDFEVELALKEGMNSVVLSAADKAGNTNTAALMVFVDSQPPQVFIQSPKAGYTTTEASIDVQGLAHDLVIGSVTDEDVTVDVNGIAATVASGQFVASGVPLALGENTLTATATDIVGLKTTATITVTRVSGATKHLKVISGNAQTGEASGMLGEVLAVQLVDAAGAPIVGHDVLFAVTASNGSLASAAAASVSNNGRLLLAVTDGDGIATTAYTLGTRAGAAVDRVTVSAVGAVASVAFYASAEAGVGINVHTHMGNNQVGKIGTPFPEPLSVVITDAVGNRVAGQPVTFTVTEGDGKFGGSASVTVTSNAKGFADVVYTPGEDIGYASHVVEASVPLPLDSESTTELGATFVLSAFMEKNTTMTAVKGLVLDEDGLPLAGVAVRFPGFPEDELQTVFTDEQGAFAFMDAPQGHVLMEIDGNPAVPEDADYKLPVMTFEVNLQEGVVTELPGPIHLLKLAKGQFVDGLFGVDFTIEAVPGFKLSIPAGTKVTFPDGSNEGMVSVTQVHFDQAPMAPVDGLQSRLLLTIQPPGVHFDPPAPLQVPNTDGYKPGEKVEMFSFDHDVEAFVPIGTGQVSEDGTVIRSDPGVGVVKGGWHCGSNPSGSGSSAPVTAKLVTVPPKWKPPEGGFNAKNKKGLGIGGGGTYPVGPTGPTKLKASGSPGKDTYWQWCGSGDVTVSGGSCADQTSCDGQVTPNNSADGTLGKARVLHICKETKACAEDTIDVVVCNAPPNKKEFTISAEKALPLKKWGNIFKGWAEKLGCDFSCSVHCDKGKACGDSCIPKAHKCTWPPGTACDKGQTEPMKASIELKIESQDLCCPGCPSNVETNTDITLTGKLGFAGDCATPWGKSLKVAGFKLKIGLFVDFAVDLTGNVGVQIDNCCPTPPCFCAKGGVGISFGLGGSLKATLDAPGKKGGVNLVTAVAGIKTGVQANAKVDCDKICGEFGTLPVVAYLTFTIWNGWITVAKASYEILPAFTYGPECTSLDLSTYAPKPKKGCPTTPPTIDDPSCSCADVK